MICSASSKERGRLNRTSVGLKLGPGRRRRPGCGILNRTSVGLKLRMLAEAARRAGILNRTSVGLKLADRAGVPLDVNPSIEPAWD